MLKENFIDYVKVQCTSGNGGKGSTHLRREKFEAKGGPDGGDGGRGGHIIIRGNKQLWTLLHLRYKRHIKAGHGGDGSKSRSSGAQGDDVYIDLPIGSIIKDVSNEKQLNEVEYDGQEIVILQGGKGGLGNDHFKSPTNQTPRYAQPGEKGNEQDFIIELKILADVGLVGFPNVGKSTLLATVTAAKPKIADYEFTTLKPNIGVVAYHNYQSFVMADIPGIIEGASQGKGLGIRFLKHIERNQLLLFLVSADDKHPLKTYKTLLGELQKYNPQLLDKERVIAISKSDLITPDVKRDIEKEMKGLEIIFISSATQMGIDMLKDKLWKKLNE